MSENLPNAKSSPRPEQRDELKRIIAERSLSGLANDTKWNELLNAMRNLSGWCPSYRVKCVDAELSSQWDTEWFYHLPFPLISVEWLDLTFLEEIRIHRLPVQIELIDHSHWIEELLKKIGLDYCKGKHQIRIFGYFPRDMSLFDSDV
jgi:hypothetical protein